MHRSVEAVVVGAGVIGASIAFHLTRRGVRGVLLLDKGTLAGQASGRSGALVRTHYPNAPEARLALASLPWFQRWDERVGGDCGFTRTGFLQLVAPADLPGLRRNVGMLRALGIDTTLVGRREIAELLPQLRLHEDEHGAYEPQSGYADPVATTRALAAAAKRDGATLLEGVEVTALLTSRARAIGVQTTGGPVHAGVVVLACGAWSGRLTRPLGLELPIHARRTQLAIFSRPAGLPRGRAGHPVLIDRANGFYARPCGEDEALVGLSGFHEPIADPDAYAAENDPDFPALARQLVSRRLPAMADGRYVRGHAGPLDVTPDGCAILGRAPGIDGLYLAVGMSGTGFKKAPAVGACVAELITAGAATTAPIEPFRPTRFEEGDPIRHDSYALPAEALRGGAGLVH